MSVAALRCSALDCPAGQRGQSLPSAFPYELLRDKHRERGSLRRERMRGSSKCSPSHPILVRD